jgi:hypothetical protein
VSKVDLDEKRAPSSGFDFPPCERVGVLLCSLGQSIVPDALRESTTTCARRLCGFIFHIVDDGDAIVFKSKVAGVNLFDKRIKVDLIVRKAVQRTMDALLNPFCVGCWVDYDDLNVAMFR